MRNNSLLFIAHVSVVMLCCSCLNKTTKEEKETPSSYFDNTEQGIQTGGVKMIFIRNSEGKI